MAIPGSCDQVSGKKELTAEQLQRIEVSKKRAKEKLAAKEKLGTSKKQKQQNDRVQSLNGPGTPVRVGGSETSVACATVGEFESPAIGDQVEESPVKSKRGRPSRNPCAVCLEVIINGKLA